MHENPLVLEVRNCVATITLTRPAQHNALGGAEIALFRSLLDAVERDTSVRALLLTGAGDRTFCSGAALNELEAGTLSGADFDTLTSHIAALPIPTVCALNGSVYGGGAEIALCCDYRLGVQGMRLLVPAASIGLCYPLAGLRRYVETLGLDAARRILVGAEQFDAGQLQALGYLHRVVDAERLKAEAEALSAHLAGLAPLAVRTMKHLLRGIADTSLDHGEAVRLIDACARSADLREGLAARREGRRPGFAGH